MRDNYDFSDAIKNPFAKKLKEEGCTVIIRYNPVNTSDNFEYVPLPEEIPAFEEYQTTKSSNP